MQAVASSLLSAKYDFLIANLALSSTVYHVSEGNLFVRAPCVRKYCIRRKIVDVCREAELAIIVALEKTHYSNRFEGL
jgi:hypothetical protein